MSASRDRSRSPMRSPRGSPREGVDSPVDPNVEVPEDMIPVIQNWEPVFPAASKLLSLVEDVPDSPNSPALRHGMADYDKKTLTPRRRAVDGWRSATPASNMPDEKKRKHQLISDILSRWWYYEPDFLINVVNL